MSIKNLFSDKKGKIVISLLAFILIIAVTFGITYHFMYGSDMSKYKKSIKEAVSYIDKSNNNAVTIYNYMKDDNIQVEKFISTLEESKKDLESASKILKESTPLDENKTLHSNLLNGISSNKTLFTQANSIFENYSSDTVNDSINSLYEYLSTTSSYYEKFNFKGISPSLSNEFLNFPDKIGDYINSLTKETDSSAPNYDMQMSFLNDIKNNFSELNTLESELNEKIDTSKNGDLSSKQLMISISSTKNKVSSIKEEINSLVSLPEVEDVKKDSLAVCKLYENYLTAFRKSIETSKEPETTYIVSSSIKINQSILDQYNTKKSSFEKLIAEKENTFTKTP